MRPSKNSGKWFIYSATAIFVITGLAKLASGFGNTKFLDVDDPFLGIPFRYLLLGTGVIELIIAGLAVFTKIREQVVVMLIAWMSTMFLAYRGSLWITNWKRPCGCLGNLTDSLNISPDLADNVMKLVLAYLLIGSYGIIIARYKNSSAGSAEALPANG